MERRRDVLPPLMPGKGPRLLVLSLQIKIKPRSSLPLPCGPGSGGDAALCPPWASIVLPGPGVRSAPPLCRALGGCVAGSWCRPLGSHLPRGSSLGWRRQEGEVDLCARVLSHRRGRGEARRAASLPPKAWRGRAQLAAETCPVCSHQRPAARAAARTTGALLQPCGRRWASGGEGRAAFFSGVCSASCLCPPHAFARCQLFSLPISVTDVLGIFPDHIHLAASFRCRLLQAVGVPPACAQLYLEFVSLLGYF